MNDDAAHREEHIGRYLQNADWKNDSRFSLRSVQICYCPLLYTKNEKTPLRFSIFELGPLASAPGPILQQVAKSRRVRRSLECCSAWMRRIRA